MMAFFMNTARLVKVYGHHDRVNKLLRGVRLLLNQPNYQWAWSQLIIMKLQHLPSISTLIVC